ncbi:hypothetical protein OHA21_14075 [Actinoplanes sp. NBC_00393]|uniref:hypothetical protein n=1 Tax=Actinoplanes sp. NBC_00393 TaxID=2975953 RepID=UPI002E214838
MTGTPWWCWCWRVALAGLAAGATGTLLIGLRDLFRASDIAARITGGVLVLVAALALGAIVTAFSGRSRRQWLPGAVAAAVMLLLSLWVAVSILSWRQVELTAALVVSVLIAVTAGYALLLSQVVRTFAAAPPPATDEGQKNPGEPPTRRGELLGALATLAAAVFALPLAWYSAHYLPTHTGPSVSIKLQFGEMTAHKTQAAVPLTITVENTGTVDARMIGSLYEVSGVKVLASPASTGPEPLDLDRLKDMTDDNYGPGARYSNTTHMEEPELIQFGQVVWDQSTLLPDETTEATIMVFFPLRTYDVLRGGVDIAIARDDRLPIGRPVPGEADPVGTVTPCGPASVVVREWPIETGSLLEQLTEERREIIRGMVIKHPDADGSWWSGVPYLEYQVQRLRETCEHLFAPKGELEEESMAGLSGAMGEILVPAEMAPRAP